MGRAGTALIDREELLKLFNLGLSPGPFWKYMENLMKMCAGPGQWLSTCSSMTAHSVAYPSTGVHYHPTPDSPTHQIHQAWNEPKNLPFQGAPMWADTATSRTTTLHKLNQPRRLGPCISISKCARWFWWTVRDENCWRLLYFLGEKCLISRIWLTFR